MEGLMITGQSEYPDVPPDVFRSPSICSLRYLIKKEKTLVK